MTVIHVQLYVSNWLRTVPANTNVFDYAKKTDLTGAIEIQRENWR